MKVYVASSFSLIPKVEVVVEALEYSGHEITCKWWKRIYQIKNLGPMDTQKVKKRYEHLESDDFYSRPETAQSYYADLEGIEEADVLILVAADIPRNYGGANIELGYALGLGKACFSIGNLPNSALYFEVVKCKTIKELDAELKEIEDEL